MAMPPPDKPRATISNREAWCKIASNDQIILKTPETRDTEGKTIPKPPMISGIVRQREDSPVPEIGSDGFTAEDARKSANVTNEEYTREELSKIVDTIMGHIRECAENGATETGIETKNFNNGLRKALMKELKHRGFSVSEEKVDGIGVLGLNVSWEPFDWAAFRKSLIGPAAGIIIVALICAIAWSIGQIVEKKRNPPAPTPIEQPLERSK